MRILLSIVLLLALTGCSDVVTTRFVTLAEAKERGAFERGWLPPILPDSSGEIVERNNLDLNTGKGSFEYNLSERPSYMERLAAAGAVSRPSGESDILEISSNGSYWEIRLPRNSGMASWKVHNGKR